MNDIVSVTIPTGSNTTRGEQQEVEIQIGDQKILVETTPMGLMMRRVDGGTMKLVPLGLTEGQHHCTEAVVEMLPF